MKASSPAVVAASGSIRYALGTGTHSRFKFRFDSDARALRSAHSAAPRRPAAPPGARLKRCAFRATAASEPAAQGAPPSWFRLCDSTCRERVSRARDRGTVGPGREGGARVGPGREGSRAATAMTSVCPASSPLMPA